MPALPKKGRNSQTAKGTTSTQSPIYPDKYNITYKIVDISTVYKTVPIDNYRFEFL